MPATRTRSSSIRRQAAPPGSTPRGPPSASPRRRAEPAGAPRGRARAWRGPSRGVRRRPPLGQHFLRDPKLLTQIVDALEPAPGDVVLEIGAGRGSLTEQLLARGLRVVAMEKDRRLAAQLGTRNAERGTELLTIVHGDALQLDWHALIDTGSAVPRSDFRVPRFKSVGNIPYAITSPLIDKALTPPLPERIVFLVQREVAGRLAARPGSRAYGALRVGVQATCRVERLFGVRAGAFHPAPQVASALVRLRSEER